jgi:hypothetical protein
MVIITSVCPSLISSCNYETRKTLRIYGRKATSVRFVYVWRLFAALGFVMRGISSGHQVDGWLVAGAWTRLSMLHTDRYYYCNSNS